MASQEDQARLQAARAATAAILAAEAVTVLAVSLAHGLRWPGTRLAAADLILAGAALVMLCDWLVHRRSSRQSPE